MAPSVNLQPAVDRIPNHFRAATETHDAEAHGRCITGWQGCYEHVGRQVFRGAVTELWLWPLQIIHERLDQPLVWRGSAWSGALVFVSIPATRGNLSFGGRALASSTVTVLPCNFLNDSFSSAPIDSITIAVQESALASYAKKVLGRVLLRESPRHILAITDAEAVDACQCCVATILGELKARPEMLDDEHFCMRVRDRVLNMLVRVLDATVGAAQQLAPPSTRTYVVEKAIQYMDARLADPVEMVELCQTIRVCPRTLRYSFEEVLGVSPTQYLLATRLSRVRRALLRANAASNVQCVAARFGFSHMGRFARFYSDTFGERPSDTLRRGGIQQRFADGFPNGQRSRIHEALAVQN